MLSIIKKKLDISKKLFSKVDNIILNYNPFVMNKGKTLFKDDYFENKLKLERIVKEQEDMVQVHYSVIN